MSRDTGAQAAGPAAPSPDAVGAGTGGAGGTGAMTPAQKAAVIIALMGEAAAKPIVARLDDRALVNAAGALESIKLLTKDQLVQIIAEFLTILGRQEGAFRGGRSTAHEVISGLIGPERMADILGEPQVAAPAKAPSSDTVWSALAERPAEEAAAYLESLPPNLTAMILKKLETAPASAILSELPEAKLASIISSMATIKTLDAEMEQALAQMIQIEFLNRPSTDDEAGDDSFKEVGAMISLVPSRKRDPALEQLKIENEAAYETINKAIFTVDKVPDLLPRNQVPALFKALSEVQQVDLLASLNVGNKAVADYLLENISTRMADRIRGDVDADPDRAEDAVEATLRDFLTLMMELRAAGTITLNEE